MLLFSDVDFDLLRPHLRHPDDMAVLPFSSGTTGLPKGVMLSHNNIGVNCEQISVKFGEYPIVLPTTNEFQEVSPSVLPFFHIYGTRFFDHITIVARSPWLFIEGQLFMYILITIGFTVLLMSKLALGTKLVTLPEFNPTTFLNSIRDHKATLLHLVPPICKPI